MSDRRIYFRADDAGFSVTGEPPLDGADLDQSFGSHRQVFGYACGIRMVHGLPWPICRRA